MDIACGRAAGQHVRELNQRDEPEDTAIAMYEPRCVEDRSIVAIVTITSTKQQGRVQTGSHAIKGRMAAIGMGRSGCVFKRQTLATVRVKSGERPSVKDCAWAGQRHGRLRFPVPFTHPKYVVGPLAQESCRVWRGTTYASGLFADGVVFSCFLRGESGILDEQWLDTGLGRSHRTEEGF